MSATESLAAVDTICVDKTGTLTDGELRLLGVEVAEGVEPEAGARGAGPLRRQRRRPQPHPGGDRRALPGAGRAGQRRGPVLLGVEVERRCALGGDAATCSAPRTCSTEAGALTLPPGPRRASSSRRPRPGAGSSPSASRPRPLPDDPAAAPPPRLTPLALVVLEETLRPDAAETIAFMRDAGSRPEADLRRRPGDRHRGRLRGRGARATPASIEGPELPEDPEELAEAALAQHDLLPDQARAEEGAGRGAVASRAATRR